MSAFTCDLDNFESADWELAARRTEPARKPPRRASPRFSSRKQNKGHFSGMHKRGNKRCGC